MFDRLRTYLGLGAPDRPSASRDAFAEPTAIETSVVIRRADGTIVDLGVVSAAYRDPGRQADWDAAGAAAASARIRAANRVEEH